MKGNRAIQGEGWDGEKFVECFCFVLSCFCFVVFFSLFSSYVFFLKTSSLCGVSTRLYICIFSFCKIIFSAEQTVNAILLQIYIYILIFVNKIKSL